MRAGISALIVLAACHSSDSQKASGSAATPPVSPIAVEGYGVRLVPAPSTSAAQLANHTIVFGPLATAPRPDTILNVAVKTGKPPTKLEAKAEGAMTVYTDGAADTTKLALGVNQTTYDGVLKEVGISPRTGAWTVVVDGKEQAWMPGKRLDVAADGHYQLVEPN